MKRKLVIAAALLGLFGASAPAGLAMARGGRDEVRGEARGDIARGPERSPRGERRDERPLERRGWDNRQRDRWDTPDGSGGYGPPRALRRGGFLPDGFEGGVVRDYPRYRLRAPPYGYAWVRTPAGYALVSLADGRVFDVIE